MDRLENVAGVIINPATEDKQDLIALLLAQLQFNGNQLIVTSTAPADTGIVANLEIDTLSSLILDSNSDRKSLLINTKEAGCFINTSMSVSVSNHMVWMPPKTVWEFRGYTGPLWACTESGTHPIKVTEFI